MRIRLISFLLLPLLFQLHCCAREENKEEREILAKINDYTLTLDEFHTQLAAELEMDPDFKITEEAKKEFLEGLIRKELLIQEAKRRNLDRNDKFIRAIERYWESTLIRDLMEVKGKEIEKKTIVSQEEIQFRYENIRKSGAELPPLENIKEEISQKIMEQKKQKSLEEWINNLRRKADIEINNKLLLKK